MPDVKREDQCNEMNDYSDEVNVSDIILGVDNVYLIHATGSDEYKIGYSKNPVERLRGLKTGNGKKIKNNKVLSRG